MAEATGSVENRDPVTRWLTAGIPIGLVTGLLVPGVMLVGVGALIGVPTVIGGWMRHVGVTVVKIGLFAAIVSGTGLRRYTASLPAFAVLALAYGVLEYLVYMGVVIPLWAGAVGTEVHETMRISALTFGVQLVVWGIVALRFFYSVRWLCGREPVAADIGEGEPGAS